jgi:diacylglycerol kinase (ATP)
MKLSIIANPVAGGGRPYRAIQRCVREWAHPGWEAEILTTHSPNHAGVLAQELIGQPPDLLAVCGGDGTINEVASHIPDPPFPVAILPAGTANVLARELRLPLDPVQALHVALKRKIRKVDLCEMGPGKRRKFLFVAGIGFDANAVFRVRPALKKKLGMAAYAIAVVDCLRSYAFPEFQVTIGERCFIATSCLVCNAKRYGGGLLFCPDADMGDGWLDILILQGHRRIALAWFLLLAWLGIPESGNWICRLKADALKIEGPGNVLIQTDGELAGGLPLHVNLIHATFPLVIP